MSKYRLVTQEEISKWNTVEILNFKITFKNFNNILLKYAMSDYFEFGKEFNIEDNLLIEYYLSMPDKVISFRLSDDFTYPINSFVKIEEKPKKITHKIRNYV